METAEARLKRMAMRSWRRGMKEMDLILGPYAEAHLAEMSQDQLLIFDRLLAENDQDLLAWVLGQQATPSYLTDIIAEIGSHARLRLTAG